MYRKFLPVPSMANKQSTLVFTCLLINHLLFFDRQNDAIIRRGEVHVKSPGLLYGHRVAQRNGLTRMDVNCPF